MLTAMLDPATAMIRLQEAHGADSCVEIRDLKVRDVHVRDGWIVQYTCRVATGSSGSSQSMLLTAQQIATGDQRRYERRLLRVRPNDPQERRLLTGLIGHHAQAGFLTYPFPLDLKLPHLVEAVQRKAVLTELQTASPDTLGQFGEVKHFTAKALRYVSGRRCQLLFTLVNSVGSRLQLLGKVFRDSRGEQLGCLMNDVADLYADFGDESVSAPRSLGYSSRLRMLFQEFVPGETLLDRMHSGEADEAAIAGAARAAVVFHHSRLAPTARYEIDDEWEILKRSRRQLSDVGETSDAFGQLFRAIGAECEHLRGGTLAPVHRDFYDRQLLQTANHTALIDLDQAAIGNPEIDIANFLVHLRLRMRQGTISNAQASLWKTKFLSEYSAASESEPCDRRLSFFFASACLRMAAKYRLRGAPQELVSNLLNDGRSAIATIREYRRAS